MAESYPCKSLIFGKMGYHRCSKMPMKDPETGEKTFACCSCVWVLALGDIDNFNEKDAEKQCPEKYTWNQMKAKVNPAITVALALQDRDYRKLTGEVMP